MKAIILKKIFHKLADNTKTDSFASRYRRKRLDLFSELLNTINKPEIDILDVGGYR